MVNGAYPQISRSVSIVQLAYNSAFSPANLQKEAASLALKADISYTTPNVNQVSPQRVLDSSNRVLEIFAAVVPGEFNSSKGTFGTEFDASLTMEILDIFPMSPYEAAQEGVWSHITLRVLPGLAMWRFPNKSNNPAWERYIGTERNTFKRLWWRAYMLGPELSSQLRENDLIQMFERGATVGSNKEILRAIAEEAISRKDDLEALGGKSSDLVSEIGKRLKRQLASLAFEAMPKETAQNFLSSVAKEAFVALKQTRS
jgi:hypothetical protein